MKRNSGLISRERNLGVPLWGFSLRKFLCIDQRIDQVSAGPAGVDTELAKPTSGTSSDQRKSPSLLLFTAQIND